MAELQEKEQSAKVYVRNAQKAVKIIKLLVIAAGALAGVLLIFGIIALTVMKNNTQGALIGFIIILVFIGLIFIAVIAMFIYAKINLNKLKKLN